jgi:hypothetical protein
MLGMRKADNDEKKTTTFSILNLFKTKKDKPKKDKPKKNIPSTKKKNSTLVEKERSDVITEFLIDSFSPELKKPVHETFEDILLPTGFNIVSLSGKHSKKKYECILLYDIDDTIIKLKASNDSRTLQINQKDELLKEIKFATEKGYLIGVLTARSYHEMQFDNHLLSAINILNDIGIDFFKFIIFTNQHLKCIPMETLKKHYDLLPHQLCLVDDDILQRTYCEAQRFKTVNVLDPQRHQEVLEYVSDPSQFSYLNGDDLPPPLEKVTDEPSNDFYPINIINIPLKACFIFTDDWLKYPIPTEYMSFFENAYSNHFAFILITQQIYNRETIVDDIKKHPILISSFYGIGYTNGHPSYEELLQEIQKMVALPAKDIVLTGETSDVVRYGDLFGFGKVSISPAYLSRLSTYERRYTSQEKEDEKCCMPCRVIP